MTIGTFQAKTELSRLLRQTRAGKTFIITQRGQPVAELRPVPVAEEATSGWGDLEGKIRMANDFWDEIEDLRDYLR